LAAARGSRRGARRHIRADSDVAVVGGVGLMLLHHLHHLLRLLRVLLLLQIQVIRAQSESARTVGANAALFICLSLFCTSVRASLLNFRFNLG
jgi:hypothetical protein